MSDFVVSHGRKQRRKSVGGGDEVFSGEVEPEYPGDTRSAAVHRPDKNTGPGVEKWSVLKLQLRGYASKRR